MVANVVVLEITSLGDLIQMEAKFWLSFFLYWLNSFGNINALAMY